MSEVKKNNLKFLWGLLGIMATITGAMLLANEEHRGVEAFVLIAVGLVVVIWGMGGVLASLFYSGGPELRAMRFKTFAQEKGFSPSVNSRPLREVLFGGSFGDGIENHYEKKISFIDREVTLHIFDLIEWTVDEEGNKLEKCYITHLVVKHPFKLPEIEIRPEFQRDKMTSKIGIKDIKFESEEFNREFWVQSKDRAGAYDIITAKVMDLMLHGGKNIEIKTGHFYILFRAFGPLAHVKINPDNFGGFVDFIMAFLDGLPPFIGDKYK